MWHLWRREEVQTGCWWGNLTERDNLDNLGLGRKIILKFVFKKWDGGIDWIGPAQDRDRWGALANVVMNLRVP
jgi:hypothetical protein